MLSNLVIKLTSKVSIKLDYYSLKKMSTLTPSSLTKKTTQLCVLINILKHFLKMLDSKFLHSFTKKDSQQIYTQSAVTFSKDVSDLLIYNFNVLWNIFDRTPANFTTLYKAKRCKCILLLTETKCSHFQSQTIDSYQHLDFRWD